MITTISSKQILHTALIAFATLASQNGMAQLPEEKNNIVYSVSGNMIYNYDPTQQVEAGINPKQNKIALPAGAKNCIAVSKNINEKSPATTFYTIVDGFYYYYNGTKWLNTGHSCGNTNINNISSGGNYLYHTTDNNDKVYVYNGKENGMLLTKVNFGASTDEISLKNDHGKFFVLKATAASTTSSQQSSKTGASGIANLTMGGGFAIINGSMYVSNLDEFNAGSDEGNSIIFESAITSYPASALKN